LNGENTVTSATEKQNKIDGISGEISGGYWSKNCKWWPNKKATVSL